MALKRRSFCLLNLSIKDNFIVQWIKSQTNIITKYSVWCVFTDKYMHNVLLLS